MVSRFHQKFSQKKNMKKLKFQIPFFLIVEKEGISL
jgi:glucokinase